MFGHGKNTPASTAMASGHLLTNVIAPGTLYTGQIQLENFPDNEF